MFTLLLVILYTSNFIKIHFKNNYLLSLHRQFLEFGTGGISGNPQRGPLIVSNMAAPGGRSVLFVCLGKKDYKISPDLL